MSNHHHGHSHGRGRGSAGTSGGPIGRAIWIVTGALALLTLIGLVALWPRGAVETSSDASTFLAAEPETATVASVSEADCEWSTPEEPQICRTVTLDPDGDAFGDESPTMVQAIDALAVPLETGDDLYVSRTELPDGSVSYSFFDYRRSAVLVILALLFAGTVVLLGGWKGLGALGGLAASLVVLVAFLLPSILRGNSPVLVALVAASTIAFIALFLAHGPTISTAIALLGTFGALAVTGIVSWVFADVAKFTGLTDDSAFYLQILGAEIDMRGIVLAGFVIGALGVLDDVTVTQVSAVGELIGGQTEVDRRAVFRSALNIGRDHISSTVNTLVLAYAGASLPLMLLFTQSNLRVSTVASQEVVATEIVRSLAGSIGLVAAVPITTLLAVWVLTASGQSEPPLDPAASPLVG